METSALQVLFFFFCSVFLFFWVRALVEVSNR